MSSTRLDTVKRILEEALDLPPEEHGDFLAQACAGDRQLKQEVESLLTHEDADKIWSEGPILQPKHNGTIASLEPDQRVGPYRILKPLGEGGMGSVALAIREDDFEKRVAVKVIRPGQMSPELARRFHNERQLLARLEHPNIARILDGGTTDKGQPFFAMEFVEGVPIDEYCTNRALPIRDRLKLFLEICSALRVAHRNLIIHRDLKPSNILVTHDGELKLLDFGIAKRLDPEAPTVTGVLNPMTVKYASPEQIDGRPLTTGSDVYSLGVLLYELLTDTHPHSEDGGETLELARTIREDDPKPPSHVVGNRDLQKQLAGDLDSIVLKAMRKELEHRYDSVVQLADDVHNYLDGREVSARDGTRAYRAGKFIRRHQLALTTAILVFLTVTGLGATAALLWRQAAQGQEQAEVARQRERGAFEFVGRLLSSGIDPDAADRELTASEILRRGEERIVEETDDPLLQAEILLWIGEAYASSGDLDSARIPWERVERRLRAQYPDGHPTLAKAINNLAGLDYYASSFEEAEARYTEALEMKLELGGDHHSDIAKSLINLATIYMTRGDFSKAEPLYQKGLELRRAGDNQEETARALRSLGILYYNHGLPERSEPLLQESLEIRQQIHEPDNTRIATSLTSLGRLRQSQARYREAEELFVEAFEIRQKKFDANHPHLAWSKLDLARLYLETQELKRGMPLLKEALATFLETKDEKSWEVAEAKSVLGGYYLHQEKYEAAEPLLTGSYENLARLRGEQDIYTRKAQHRLETLQALDESTTQATDGSV